MLTVARRRESDISIVELSGSINANSYEDFQSSVVDNPNGPGDNILLNLENLSNISSFGIGILVTACMEVQKQGRTIMLVKVSPDILEKLDFYKVLPVFNIFFDFESATKQIKIDVEDKGKAYVRLFERIDVQIGAKYRLHKKGKKAAALPFQNAMAMNLTKRGIFIKTDDLIDLDILIDVKLSLGKGFFKKESVSFLGKVVRRIEGVEGMDTGIALIILHMDVKDMERLEN